jgi:putative ABC transport system substrate-binding protein
MTLVGGAAAARPLVARAQQSAVPVIGLVSAGSGNNPRNVAAFRQGLNKTGYVEGQNVAFEYRQADGQYDRLPALAADLVRRRVAVIVAVGDNAAIAAKAATPAIPIVFMATENPVKLGLVASLARPGGNATGSNFFSTEVEPKRLGLLHDLVPKAVRVAVLWNPNPLDDAPGDTALQNLQEAARILGLQIRMLNATTIGEIDAAFATLARERPDALFVTSSGFFNSRREQIASLAARDRIPASYGTRESIEVGGLMSYGTDSVERWRQVGVYTGSILKGAKPADLPVVQSTKFELGINLQSARLLGIEVPPNILAIADEVID